MKKFTRIFLALTCVLLSRTAIAQPAGWSFFQAYTVTNPGNTLILDYQMPFTMNTAALISASQMQASGNDIRWGKNCAGNPFYSYWIESGLNSATTKIWVKIDSLLPNTTRTVYMFYGNPSAPAASTLSIFQGPFSSTNQVTGGTSGGVADYQRGFRFSPNVDVLMFEMGKNTPDANAHYATLFNYTTQAIVAQLLVPGAANAYGYLALPAPIWLTQNTQYILSLHGGTVNWNYFYQTSSQINSNLTYYDMRYCNSCNQNTFPTTVLTNYHYGYPDFRFYTRNTVTPAPTYVTGGGGPAITQQPVDKIACPGASATFSIQTSSPSSSITWQMNTGSGWVTVPTAAPYSGTATNTLSISTTTTAMNGTLYRAQMTGGCAGLSYSNQALLTVNPAYSPNASITWNQPLKFCDGSGVVLNANNVPNTGMQWQWWRNNVPIPGATTQTYNAMTTGNYSVYETNQYGCTDTSDFVPVTTYPIPNPVISRTNLTLSATAGFVTYQWWYNGLPVPGASSPSIVMNANGVYYVVVTDPNGCEGRSASYFLGNLSVQSSTIAAEDVRLFPNPASNVLHIESPRKVNAFVRSMDGRLLLHSIGASSLDVSSLPVGMYTVLVTDTEGRTVKTEKLVKSAN